MLDQNQINYPTGPSLNFSTYNATSKPDQILDWLEFNCFVLQRQIKIRPDTKAAETQPFRLQCRIKTRSDIKLVHA